MPDTKAHLLLQAASDKKRIWWEYLILLLITAMGAYLRLYHLAGISLSNDELSALNRLRFGSFLEMIKHGVQVDGHPAGVQVFLWYWTHWFGDDVVTLRLPFAIIGILTIPTCYAWARIWFGRLPALFTAGTLATLQFPIFYSQLARPYAPGLFFCMLLTWLWTQIMLNGRRWWHFVSFAITAALCAYTHYFSFLFAVIIGLLGLIYVPRPVLKWYLLAGIGAVILYLPHLGVLSAQLKLGGLEWLGPPGKGFLLDYILHIFDDSWLMLGIALLIFIISLWAKKNYADSSKGFRLLALLFFLLPFLVGYLKSVWGKPVLQYSTLLFSFPFLPAFLFSFLGRIRERMGFSLMVIWTCISLYWLFFQSKYYQTEQYGLFKPFAEKITHWDDSLGSDKITRVININFPYYIQYYYNKAHRHAHFSIYRLDSPEGLDTLFDIVSQSHTPYLMYAWSNIAHPWEAEAIIRLKYSDTVHFEKHFISEIGLFKAPPEKQHALLPFQRIQPDSGKESYTGPLQAAWQGRLLRLSCQVEADSLTPDAEIVVSSETDGKVYDWKTIHLNERLDKPNQPKEVHWFTYIPQRQTERDTLRIYLWNHSSAKVSVHNFAAEVY